MRLWRSRSRRRPSRVGGRAEQVAAQPRSTSQPPGRVNRPGPTEAEAWTGAWSLGQYIQGVCPLRGSWSLHPSVRPGDCVVDQRSMSLELSVPGRGSIIVAEATSMRAGMKGLLGTDGLEPGRGLLLRGRQVHTFGMRYPIDAVYLDGERRVIKVRTLPPNRMGPLVFRAKHVLELGAGEAKRAGIEPSVVLAPR